MTDARTTRSLGALVIVFVVVALAGCGGSKTVDDHVVVVGDSILQMSTKEVEAALRAAGWKPAVMGVYGSTIRGGTQGSWPKTVHNLVRLMHPKVAVVELGTNDAMEQRCCGHVGDDVDALMHELRDVPHVQWLNVQEGRTFSASSERVNRELRAATKRWSNLQIVDFSDRFKGHPDWHSGPGPHLTPAGQVAFAQLVVQATAPWAPHDTSNTKSTK